MDVDGSLVAGDLLVDGIADLIRSRPHRLLLLPWWLVRGRAVLKREVANSSSFSVDTVLFRDAVLAEVRHAQESGRQVWLASGADERVVAPISALVGATGYIASDGENNLIANQKASALVQKFGVRGFDYIGNGRQDLPVWRQCRCPIGVGLSRGVQRRLKRIRAVPHLLPSQNAGLKDYVTAFRPHQWMKNLLVFVPALAAHSVDPSVYLAALGAFVALSLCASGTYVVNDFLDLPHDRRHNTKRRRPIASGRIPQVTTFLLGLLLTVLGLLVSFGLPGEAGPWLLTYVAGTLAYSLHLKRQFFLDVLLLAFLYAIRVLIGGAAVDIAVSPWLIAFSLFAFLALAIVKRLVELGRLDGPEGTPMAGRPYVRADTVGMGSLSTASAFASVVVLAVYIGSTEVVQQYETPELLWLVCPLVIYWFGRIVLLANRGMVDDDPVVFAARDKVSWIVGIGTMAVFLLAS